MFHSSCLLQCDKGWYGADCSIPSVLSSVTEWPKWLRPAQVNIPDDDKQTGKIDNLNAVVEKKRPLIYVYDLPPEFNSLLLEVRKLITNPFFSPFYSGGKHFRFLFIVLYIAGPAFQVRVCKQNL